MKKIMCFLISMIALAMSGCAAMSSLSKEERASIRTVEVKVTEHPNSLFIYAPGNDLKAAASVLLFGPAGPSLYASLADDSGAGLLGTYLKQNNIVIKDIVSTEVSRKLAELGFKTVPAGGDAILKVEIMSYGFNQARVLSSELRGSVWLAATLVRPDGKSLIGRRVGMSSVFPDLKSHTTQEVFADPSIAREHFTHCSALAFADLAKPYGEAEKQ